MSTEQPKPLTGYRESQETKKEIHVDEKRFKDELHKVTESDQSQQKDKRNLRKSEEETDEDEMSAKQQQIQASGALFALFMKETAKDDLLTPQTPQSFKASQAPTSTSQFTIEQDTNAKPLSSKESAQQEPFSGPLPPPLPTYQQQQAAASTSSAMQQPQSPQDQQPQEPAKPYLGPDMVPQEQMPDMSQPSDVSSYAPSPKREEKKEEKDLSLLAKYKPSKAQVEKQKEEKTPEIRLERRKEAPKSLEEKPQLPAATQQEKKPKPSTKVQPAPLGAKAHEKVEKPSTPFIEKPSLEQESAAPLAPAAPLQEKPVIASEKEALSLESIKTVKPSEDRQPSKDKDKQKDKEEKEEEGIYLQPPAPMLFTPPPTPPLPAYATLPPQVFELFEKMVGLMSIEQTGGVTTTTVTINMKNSIFDGAQIILDHYSSAPNAFNVTIAATPEAQIVLNNNLDNLVASFEASKLSFQINMRRPILLGEYQAMRKKEKVEAEPDQEKRQEFE